MEAFKSGDDSALRFFFDLYQASLYCNILALIKDSDAAEDIVIEAFIVLYSHRSEIKDDRHLIKYLFTVARNKAVEHFRLWEKTKRLVNELARLGETLYIEPMEYEYAYQELLKKIEHTIQDLPPRRKKIFHLHYHFAKDVRYIAKKMNIAEQTVRNQLNRVITALRRELTMSDD